MTVHEAKTIGRYRPNAGSSAAGDTVNEYVIEIQPIALHDFGDDVNDARPVYA